jgi:hypothetical protein
MKRVTKHKEQGRRERRRRRLETNAGYSVERLTAGLRIL